MTQTLQRGRTAAVGRRRRGCVRPAGAAAVLILLAVELVVGQPALSDALVLGLAMSGSALPVAVGKAVRNTVKAIEERHGIHR